MYNSELKSRFIQETYSNKGRRNVAEVMFKTLEPLEQEYGSDICTIPEDKVRPILSKIIPLRVNSQRTRISILKDYVRWCMNNNVPNACDAILNLKDVGIARVKEQMVANPQHLKRYLDIIFDSDTEQTIDSTRRSFYWLAYSGVQMEDVVKIRCSDVDTDRMVITFNGNEYPYCREAAQDIKNCALLKEFRFIHPSANEPVWRERAKGDFLLRGYRDRDAVSLGALRTYVSKRTKHPRHPEKIREDDVGLNLDLSYFRVWLSGVFYRVYEAERYGVSPDFTQIAQDEVKRKGLDKGISKSELELKIKRIANQYLYDYERWKSVYS